MPNYSQIDGYGVRVTVNTGGNETITLERFDDGVPTTLASDNTHNLANGDKIGLEIIGSTLKVYLDQGGGWAEILSASDGSYGDAGYIGAGLVSATGRLDNFSGGTVLGGGGISIPAVMHHRQQQGMS